MDKMEKKRHSRQPLSTSPLKILHPNNLKPKPRRLPRQGVVQQQRHRQLPIIIGAVMGSSASVRKHRPHLLHPLL
jgi:hypothetical protein